MTMKDDLANRSRRGNGCLVVTDEVGNGRDAPNLRQTDEGLMHRGHDLWLATLRWVAESKPNRSVSISRDQ